MPDGAILFAIDNTADYNVVAQTTCRRILVQENYNSASPPTQDLLQKVPAGAASAIDIPKGTVAVYTPMESARVQHNFGSARFAPGDIAGTIRTAAGSITVQQIESQQI